MTDGLRAALPFRDAVETMTHAVTHLLADHDCDRHGWETVQAARDVARQWLAATPEPAPDVEARDVEWLSGFVRAAAAHLHDVNGHLRAEQNRPASEPFDWTTNCQHGDCRKARDFVAALHPADPSRTPEVETWLAIRAALHETAGRCRDGRFDHCYDQFHSPPIKFADWWPPADPSRREP